uniref:Uncharacterized protein n=1 Tax=Marinitoga okinawensis TaxID=389480 RepID=A0A9C7GWZ9_9BACT|nr:hypothetical protein [Marinitoga okinawensis]CAI4093973.1 Hypothetical protein PMO1_21 [Marinitoga okinawensis]
MSKKYEGLKTLYEDRSDSVKTNIEELEKNKQNYGQQSRTVQQNKSGQQSRTVQQNYGQQSRTVQQNYGQQSRTVQQNYGQQSRTVQQNRISQQNESSQQSRTEKNDNGQQSRTEKNDNGQQSRTEKNDNGQQSRTEKNDDVLKNTNASQQSRIVEINNDIFVNLINEVSEWNVNYATKILFLQVFSHYMSPKFETSISQIQKITKKSRQSIANFYNELENIDEIRITKLNIGTVIDLRILLEKISGQQSRTSSSSNNIIINNKNNYYYNGQQNRLDKLNYDEAIEYSLILSILKIDIFELNKIFIDTSINILKNQDKEVLLKSILYAKLNGKNFEAYFLKTVKNRYYEALNLKFEEEIIPSILKFISKIKELNLKDIHDFLFEHKDDMMEIFNKFKEVKYIKNNNYLNLISEFYELDDYRNMKNTLNTIIDEKNKIFDFLENKHYIEDQFLKYKR